MNVPSRIAAGAPALAVIGFALACIAAWLALGIDHATLEHLRQDRPFGWLLVLGIPVAATCVGLLAVAAWLAAWRLQSRARRT